MPVDDIMPMDMRAMHDTILALCEANRTLTAMVRNLNERVNCLSTMVREAKEDKS